MLSSSLRRVAIIGGSRIPFCRSNTLYSDLSNLDMLTAAIDGLADKFDLADVEIGSYDVAIEIIGRDPEKWQPATRETADHSFPYCVAVALVDGRVSMNSFSPKRLRDPRLHELMKKIHVVNVPELEYRYPTTMPTRLTIRTAKGSTYSRQIDQPLGHPGHPLSDQEVEEKLRRLASRRIDRAQLQRLLDAVWHLEEQQDIASIMPLLRVRS